MKGMNHVFSSQDSFIQTLRVNASDTDYQLNLNVNNGTWLLCVRVRVSWFQGSSTLGVYNIYLRVPRHVIVGATIQDMLLWCNTVVKSHFSPCGLHMDFFLHTQCWDQFTPMSACWCKSCKYQLSTIFMHCLWSDFIANTTYHFLALQTNSSNHFALKADLILSQPYY